MSRISAAVCLAVVFMPRLYSDRARRTRTRLKKFDAVWEDTASCRFRHPLLSPCGYSEVQPLGIWHDRRHAERPDKVRRAHSKSNVALVPRVPHLPQLGGLFDFPSRYSGSQASVACDGPWRSPRVSYYVGEYRAGEAASE
jgi:hypothetical protein